MSSSMNPRRKLVADQFHRARRQAAIESVMARLTGQSADLLSYEAVVGKLGVRGQSPAGLRQIPVAAIIGSVGRYQDFSRTFLPRQETDEDRWVAVGSAAPVVGDLPPIEVYRVGEGYFVLDGNHRVSIARQQRVAYIDAHVIDVRTRVPLPPGARPDDLIIAAEYAAFLEYTRLDLTRPDVDLRVSVPGQFAHLECHIEAHRYHLETAAGAEVPFDEAAARWYDESYLPLVEAIREAGLLRYFPGRTETDFFVWLSRHRAEMEEALGWRISPSVAVARLLPRAQAAERLARGRPSPLRRLTQLVVPDRPAPPPTTWAAEHTLARYSTHLFADVLLPVALPGPVEAGPALGRAEMALDRSIALCLADRAQLCTLVIVDGPAAAEPAGVAQLRARLEQERAGGLASQFNVETGDATRRVIELAFLNDLVILDRSFDPDPAGEEPPTAAARRVLAEAHRPILFIGPEATTPLPGRALLVHDTRRRFDEAVFLAAYLAEQWRVALTVLTIGNGRNTTERADRAADYLALHEVAPTYLDPARPSAALPETIVAAARASDADMIILPGPGPGQGEDRHPRLDDAIHAVLRLWPRGVLVAV